MRRVHALLAGFWDFVVGDDWQTALGVVLALCAIAVLAEAGVAAWWVAPPAVLALLLLSVRRAARGASPLAPPRLPDERGDGGR